MHVDCAEKLSNLRLCFHRAQPNFKCVFPLFPPFGTKFPTVTIFKAPLTLTHSMSDILKIMSECKV